MAVPKKQKVVFPPRDVDLSGPSQEEPLSEEEPLVSQKLSSEEVDKPLNVKRAKPKNYFPSVTENSRQLANSKNKHESWLKYGNPWSTVLHMSSMSTTHSLHEYYSRYSKVL